MGEYKTKEKKKKCILGSQNYRELPCLISHQHLVLTTSSLRAKERQQDCNKHGRGFLFI